MARTAFELQRILVPVDFSGPSELALRCATAFAARFGGKIALVHVIESGRFVGEFSESDTGMTEIPRRVEEQLCSLASRSGEPALFDKVEVRTGRPSKNIGQAASELGGDLIVISTHGYTGLNYVLLGGTAERVIRHAPCPVLVCAGRMGARRSRRRFLISRPRRSMAPLRLELARPLAPGSPPSRRRALGRWRAKSIRCPRGSSARASNSGSKSCTWKWMSLPALSTRCSARAPRTTRSSGWRSARFRSHHYGLARPQRLVDMLLGSTAERVVRHAPCPVLVVREPRESKMQTT